MQGKKLLTFWHKCLSHLGSQEWNRVWCKECSFLSFTAVSVGCRGNFPFMMLAVCGKEKDCSFFSHPFNFSCLNPGKSCKFFSFPVNLVSSFIFQVNHFKSAVPLTYKDGSTCGKRNSLLTCVGHVTPLPSNLGCILLPATRCSVSWHPQTIVAICTGKDISPSCETCLPTHVSDYHNTVDVVVR